MEFEKQYFFTKDFIQSPKGGVITFKTKPYDHQLQCLAKYGDREYFALLADMGTGKTWIIINNYAYLFARGKVANMLVVAPNGVQWNWVQNEIKMHLPDKVAPFVMWAGYSGAMNKSDKDKLNALFDVRARINNNINMGKILCVNWESLSNKKGCELINNFLNMSDRNMIVLDESDYCKSPTAKRTKFVMEIAKRARYKRIMTGTPITNSPFDAWTQFNFLNENILGAPSFVAFKCRYGVFLPQNNPLVQAIKAKSRSRQALVQATKDGHPVYKNLEHLQGLIKPFSFRVLKEDCLDLPPKIYKNIYIELTKKQRAAYDIAKKEGIIQLDNDSVPILNKIAILTKLCQMTGNNVITPDGINNKIDLENNPKLEKCIELVQQFLSLNKQIIIWARYRHEILDIAEALGKIHVPTSVYFGGVSETDKRSAIDEFQLGTTKVFVANQQSGGTGITLTKASIVIYYSNSFSLHDRLQSEDRCYRIGQTDNKVIYINLLAKDTVDESIQRCLDNKLDVASAITHFKSLI